MPITPTTSSMAMANITTLPMSTGAAAGAGSGSVGCGSGDSSNSISANSSSHAGGLAGSLLTVATAVPTVTNALTLATTINTPALTNHLDVPPSNNPNLLSPDVINQRRGLFACTMTPNKEFICLLSVCWHVTLCRKSSSFYTARAWYVHIVVVWFDRKRGWRGGRWERRWAGWRCSLAFTFRENSVSHLNVSGLSVSDRYAGIVIHKIMNEMQLNAFLIIFSERNHQKTCRVRRALGLTIYFYRNSIHCTLLRFVTGILSNDNKKRTWKNVAHALSYCSFGIDMDMLIVVLCIWLYL